MGLDLEGRGAAENCKFYMEIGVQYLSVFQNLIMKRVDCSICSAATEPVTHIVSQCSLASSVWLILNGFTWPQVQTAVELLEVMQQHVSKQQLAEFFCVMWCILIGQNQVV